MFCFITVLVVTDRETGASKGFAFITYVNTKDANDAVSAMNETVRTNHKICDVIKQNQSEVGNIDFEIAKQRKYFLLFPFVLETL